MPGRTRRARPPASSERYFFSVDVPLPVAEGDEVPLDEPPVALEPPVDELPPVEGLPPVDELAPDPVVGDALPPVVVDPLVPLVF